MQLPPLRGQITRSFDGGTALADLPEVGRYLAPGNAEATSLALTLTAVRPTGAGFLTAWPADQARPTVSNINFATGQTVANGALVKVGAGGNVCLYNSQPTHLVVDVTGYFLEYDNDRAGGFAPLRFVPKGKTVVLGLVTTKSGVIETKDALKRRIDEAAKFIPLDQLALSPQCGFASGERGNALTVAEEIAKLRLVVEVAQEVWG